MRICFIAGTLGRGGAERQLLYMLKANLAERIDARVLCLTEGEPYEKEIHDLGVDIEFIGKSKNRLTRLSKVVRNLRKRPADLLQSAHFYTNIYAGAAGRMLRLPSIGAIRGDLSSEVAANGIFGKWQLSLPVSQIANSKLAIERAVARGYTAENIFLVRNAVPVSEENSGPKNRSKVRLLFAGRLIELKRPELFVELVCHLRKLLPDRALDFTIAGDGPLRPKLENLAKNKGLQKGEITFLGEMSSMRDVYKDSDILILTSAHEGTPNVLLEAMANGIPVVATRVGGVPEIVPEGCGFLVDPNDFAGLAIATSRLVLDNELRERMGGQARSYVQKNHSIGNLQEKLTSIYSTLLTNNRSRSER